RRGATSGTILLDLERHRVVALLPERAALAFARWLCGCPEVRQRRRDRGGDSAAGATLGAPHAAPIADRCPLRSASTRVKPLNAGSRDTTPPSAQQRGACPRTRRLNAPPSVRHQTATAKRSAAQHGSSTTRRFCPFVRRACPRTRSPGSGG